jgi:FkbM family methyltransferase
MPTISTVVKRLLDSEAGRRQPCTVIARLARWQLWRRGLRRPLDFTTVTGSRLRLLPGASDSLSSFWYFQLPDFEELAFSLHLLRKDDLFVDVGANQGGWSLVAAGHGARVISFEPVPLTRARLLSNIAVNPAAIRQRIRVHPVGLSDFAGRVSFTADLDAGNHRVRDGGGPREKTITVDLARADDLLADENPALIKIDVEGEELGVLNGARDILAKPSLCAVVMETFRPSNFAEPALIAAEAILGEHGFVPMAYNPWKRDLQPLLRPSDGTQNTIYVRAPSAVGARLKQAGPLRAFGTTV